MIQTKELNEHATTNATYVRADQFCLDDDDYTCNDATQCFSMESVLEAASYFSSINLMRREIELSVFNATEQSSVRNQQAHMKKFQPRKYHHNEKVLFHKPNTHGMVIIPNQVGEIINELPGGYY